MKAVVTPSLSKLDAWKDTQWSSYCAENIKGIRLSLDVSMNGNLQVSYGDEMLYQGRSFQLAKNAYVHVMKIEDTIPDLRMNH